MIRLNSGSHDSATALWYVQGMRSAAVQQVPKAVVVVSDTRTTYHGQEPRPRVLPDEVFVREAAAVDADTPGAVALRPTVRYSICNTKSNTKSMGRSAHAHVSVAQCRRVVVLYMSVCGCHSRGRLRHAGRHALSVCHVCHNAA